MTIPHTLTSIISERQTHASLPATQCAIDQLLTHYDHAIQAILFYGSCFRESTDNGLIDLYVIVDQYTSVHDRKIKAILNRILPPNVYYLEFPLDDKTIRTKYSIVSLSDFQQGTTMQWFHSYFWGRFAQPQAKAWDSYRLTLIRRSSMPSLNSLLRKSILTCMW